MAGLQPPARAKENSLSNDTRSFVREHYSKDAAEYDRVRLEDPKGRLLSDHDVWLFLKMLPPASPELRTLEVGAGTGRFTLPALDRGYHIVATDINEEMLRLLREKIQQRHLEDRCTVKIDDIFQLSFNPAEFDFAFTLHVIPRFLTLDDQAAALKELGRVLKPGGKLLFNYRNIRSPYGWLYKGHGATPDQIDRMLRDAGMKIVEQRGKWLLNKTLITRLPLFLGKMISACDRLTARVWTTRAWDVFVLAEKL